MKMLQDRQKSKEKKLSTLKSHDPHIDQHNSIAEVPVKDPSSVSTESDKSKQITREDIEVVQNLIERCLQLYMDRNEIINTLLDRARIEPGFTTLVMQKLEVENAEFFKAYFVRLKLKNQILMYNRLLERQYELMEQQVPPDVPLPPMHNGVHYMPVNNVPMGYPVMQQLPIPSNGHHHVSSCHVVNGIPAQGDFHHMPPNCGKDGIKSEMVSCPTSVASNGQFPFTASEISGLGADTSVLDPSFISHFENLERFGIGPDGEPRCFKEPLRSLGQTTWTSSLFDTAEWPHLQGIDLGALGNYPGSPFLPSETDGILDSPEQNDTVEEFFADGEAGPGQGSQSD